MSFESLTVLFVLLVLVGIIAVILLARRVPKLPDSRYGQAPRPGDPRSQPWTQQSGYPPGYQPGQYPPGYQPPVAPQANSPGYYPPANAPGYYPPTNQPGYYPPTNPPGYYPPANPPGYYPPANPPGYYPPANPPQDVPQQPPEISLEQTDLAATQRQLNRFAWDGAIAPGVHQQLKAVIAARAALIGEPTSSTQPDSTAPMDAPDPRQMGLAFADPEPAMTFEPAVPAVEPPPDMTPQVEAAPTTVAVEGGVEEAAPDQAPEAVPPPPVVEAKVPPQPHRPLGEVLAAFMEERHIRWGEIIGGMLIVACSIALVVSLWSQIAGIPLIKFFLFTAVTSAFFGVGLYSAHHWKLPITSHGALIIATLLVPLTVLALAGFSRGTASGDTLVIVGEVAALGIFLLLLRSAGRVIVPRWPGPLVLGVLGASFTMVIIRRMVNASTPQTTLWLLGAMPLAFQLAAIAWTLNRARRLEQLEREHANGLLIVIGTVCFATLAPLGLLIYKCGDVQATIHSLAPLVSLLGCPVLAGGLMLWRRVPGERLASLRTAGTTVALMGGLVMLSGVALAWPHTKSLLAVSVINLVVGSAVALVLRMPRVHFAAMPFAVLAGQIVFGLVTAVVAWGETSTRSTVNALVGAKGGHGLLILAGLIFGASVLLRRLERKEHARVYRIVAGVVSLACLALVSIHGLARLPGPAGQVAWIYVAYAVVAFGVAWRLWRPGIWFASTLALLALVQGLVFDWRNVLTVPHPLPTALILYAGLVAGGLALVRRRAGRPWKDMVVPLRWSAQVGLALSGAVVGVLWARTALAAQEVWPARHAMPVVANLLLLFIAALPWLWIRALSALKRDLAALVSVGCLAVVTVFGLGSGWRMGTDWLAITPPGHGALLVGSYGLLAILVAVAFRSRVAAGTSYLLALLSLLQGFGFQWGADLGLNEPWTWALLIYATVAVATLWMWRRRSAEADVADPFGLPLQWAALISTAVASMWLLGRLFYQDVSPDYQHSRMWLHLAAWREQRLWAYVLWVAAAWGGLAWTLSRRALLAAFQAALYLASAMGVLAVLHHQPWFVREYYPHAHPWTIGLLASGVGALSLVWMGLRMAVRRVDRRTVEDAQEQAAQPTGFLGRAHGILGGFKFPLERVVLLGVGFVGALLAISASAPGVGQELWGLSPRLWPRHRLFLDGSSWLVLGVLVVGAALALWERISRGRVLAALGVGLLPCMLVAGLAQPAGAAASTLRWCLALYLILGSALVWGRRWLRGWAESHGLVVRPGVARMVRLAMPWTIGAWMLLLSLLPVISVLALSELENPASPRGPLGALPVWLNHVVPLLVLVAVLVGHGLRERSRWVIVQATVALGLATTAATLQSVRASGGHEALLQGGNWIRLAQWVVFAGSLGWLACRMGAWLQHRRSGAPGPIAGWALAPALMVIGVQLLVVVPCALLLVATPAGPYPQGVVAGSPWGGITTALVLVILLWQERSVALEWTPRVDLGIRTILAGAVATVGVAMALADATSPSWLGHHALLVGLTLVAWLPLADGALAARLPGHTTVGLPDRVLRSTVLGVHVAALSLRGAYSDPGRPWWAVGVLAAVAVLACVHAPLLRRRTPLLLAGIVACAATTVGWATLYWSPAAWEASLSSLTSANLIVLSLMGLVSVLLLRWMEERSPLTDHVLLSLHFVALAVMSCAALVLVAAGLNADLISASLAISPWLQVSALVGTLLLAVACLWAPRTTLSLPFVFAAGGLMVGGALDVADLAPRFLGWSLSVAAAGYALVAALVLRGGRALQSLVERTGGSRPEPGALRASEWLLPAVLVLVGTTLAMALWVRLTFGAGSPVGPDGGNVSGLVARLLRFAPALAALLACMGICWNLHRRGGIWWQRAAVTMTILSTLSLVWAWNEPVLQDGQRLAPWIQLILVLGAGIAAIGVAVPRWLSKESGWWRASRPLLFGLGGAVVLSALVVVLVEWWHKREHLPIPMGVGGILLVAGTLLGLAGLAVYFALRPARAPYGNGGPWHSAYVYMAEALVALALLHLRLSLLRSSGQAVIRTWPFVVMVLAFVGVALGEVFRRRKLHVLAKPLERTGLFLPLLPVLSFWALESTIQYSSILLLVGLFYGVLAVARRSFGFGIVAVIAANGGLWNILHHSSGVGLLTHPQLWLIPLCVSLLAAAHLNRKQLSAVQMTTLRYACLTGVYVSSTVDLFINGVSSSPGLALVLSSLSVVGVLAGIALRVRSLLFLGAGFLVLSLLALIWQASTNLGWTWLWYVAGILLGVAIIIFFALFERKRHELLQVVDRLKTWDQ